LLGFAWFYSSESGLINGLQRFQIRIFLLAWSGTRAWWIPTRSATPSTALVPQRKVGFPIPNAGLLPGFQGTKTARREGISSPFSDAGGCTSPQNSGAIIFNGPLTLDQKIAQDLLVSTWPAFEQRWRNSPSFRAKDSWSLRQYAKFRRQFGTVVRLVAKRASKTNSWDLATLEERMDHLRRCHWPTISRDFPPEFVQSEYCFKSIFRHWLGIEPTEEEQQAFLVEARKVYLRLQ
jgi:hypothetical protein